MSLIKIDEELDLLSEYMDVYIQLLPHCVQCGGDRIHKPQLPTFEYFKATYDDDRYSLVIPHYKESKNVYGDRVGRVHSHGLGSFEGIARRHYNRWMGCKYFTDGNIHGDYNVDSRAVNEILKKIAV